MKEPLREAHARRAVPRMRRHGLKPRDSRRLTLRRGTGGTKSIAEVAEHVRSRMRGSYSTALASVRASRPSRGGDSRNPIAAGVPC